MIIHEHIVNRHITFIDLRQFYNGSLDTFASNLKDEGFKHLTSEFGVDKVEILKRKDAYPYEWVNSYEKLKYPSLSEKKILLFIIKRSSSITEVIRAVSNFFS